ncbi:MAG: flagellar basal body-associated FliL family protein [Alphaproteobacteria bacterium]
MAKAKKGKEKPEEAEDAEADEKKTEEGAEGEAPAKKKLPIVKLAIFAGVPVILIVAGLGAAFFLGVFGGKKKDEAHGKPGAEHHVDGKPEAAEVTFFDLPEILVNLNTGGKGSSYLKLQLAIELPKGTLPAAIEPALPRIMDRFQVFLRELRFEDLSGSAGTYRLKQELLRRVQLSGLSVQVNDVLIREMIIQ